jgi:hypothetical protein
VRQVEAMSMLPFCLATGCSFCSFDCSAAGNSAGRCSSFGQFHTSPPQTTNLVD